MRVVLLVTNAYRDLPDRVLTALYLCQRGVTCYLLPSFLRRQEVWPLVPNLVLLDNLRTGNEAQVRRFLAAGIRVAVLDTEGAIFTSIDRYADKLVPDTSLRRAVSRVCFWGPALARHAQLSGWYTESQIVVTGTPRLDFYVQPWYDAALAFSPYAGSYSQPMVLINSNFNRSNPWQREPARAIREYLGQTYDEDKAIDWLETENRTRQELVQLARRLAGEFPNVTFIFRPHPLEDAETYRHNEQGCPNLHFIKRGAVQGWILRSCALIHCGSTTAVEAVLAGRPALSPAWIPTPVRYPVVDAVTQHCASEDELKCRLRRAVDRESPSTERLPENVSTVLDEWFMPPDGHAHERVAAAILSALGEPGPHVSRRQCQDAMEGLNDAGTGWRLRLRAFARRTLRLPVGWSFRQWQQQPNSRPARADFDVADVQEIVTALQKPMQDFAGTDWQEVAASSAQGSGHFHFGYSNGSAVALSPPGARA
jgi:surface carbohydrate biosynthesis protein